MPGPSNDSTRYIVIKILIQRCIVIQRCVNRLNVKLITCAMRSRFLRDFHQVVQTWTDGARILPTFPARQLFSSFWSTRDTSNLRSATCTACSNALHYARCVQAASTTSFRISVAFFQKVRVRVRVRVSIRCRFRVREMVRVSPYKYLHEPQPTVQSTFFYFYLPNVTLGTSFKASNLCRQSASIDRKLSHYLHIQK